MTLNRSTVLLQPAVIAAGSAACDCVHGSLRQQAVCQHCTYGCRFI